MDCIISSILAYVQELGRAGRDGEPAIATLYYNKSDIADNIEHMSAEIRQYCKSTTCRREFITKYFGFELESTPNVHFCCDICRAGCQCQGCLEKAESQIEDVTDVVDLPQGVKEIAKGALTNYFVYENSTVRDYTTPALVTGLSSALAEEICSDASLWESDSLKNKYPYIESHYLENMAQLLDKVKNMQL